MCHFTNYSSSSCNQFVIGPKVHTLTNLKAPQNYLKNIYRVDRSTPSTHVVQVNL